LDRSSLPLARPEVADQSGLPAFAPVFKGAVDLLGLIIMLGVIWNILTLPLRLIVWVLDFLSRATGLVIGFALMVLGVALGAGPSLILGVPVFLVGLLLTLRSLG
jgi:hypothetical protein